MNARAALQAAFALALGSAVSLGLARFSYALLLPPMRDDLQWSYALSGLMNAANAAGYLTGTVLSFVLNSRYNFPVRDRIIARFFLFLGVALTGYLFSAFALHLLVERAGVDRYVAKSATLVAVVLIQYNLNRLISFRGADS